MPPELDFAKPKAAEPPSKPKPQITLNALTGPALLADREGRIIAANESWEESVVRAGRADLSRNGLLGRPFLNLLAEEPLRTEFLGLLPEIIGDSQRKFACTAELGTNSRPFAMHFGVRAAMEEGQCCGLLIQAADVTQDMVTRMALLDRERRLRELRAVAERQNAEIVALRQRIEQEAGERGTASAKQSQETAELISRSRRLPRKKRR